MADPTTGQGRYHPPDPADDRIHFRIPEPLSAARALAKGELGGPDQTRARLLAVLLMRVFHHHRPVRIKRASSTLGLEEEDFTPEEFIADLRSLESLGLLTDVIERRS